MIKKVLRCAIYIRVSTSEQMMHGKSLQAQREFLSKYADEHNMTIVGIFADEGKTARKELKKRKAIHSLLDLVQDGEIDVILFWKMDRWFRSVSDFYKVQDILDAHNVRWIAAAEPSINMDTREGRLNLNILLSIGQNEVDTTSERIKFTNANMIENGKVIFGENNLPLGYEIKIVDGVKRMVKKPEEEEIVNEFFRYFRIHQKKRETMLHIQEMFGIDFSYSQLRTMLSSEFYIGKYRNNANYCPAYLTLEEWDEIQRVSNRNIRSTRSGRIYLFSGLIRCPKCGQLLCGTGCSSIINRKTGEKRSYCYYRCNRAMIDSICSYRHRFSQNLIEKYLLENLETEYKKYQVQLKKASEKNEKKKKRQRTAASIKKEMNNLNLMFQKERITWDYYDKEYTTLEKELASLDNIEPIKKRNLAYLDSVFQGDFLSMYNQLEASGKQDFWRSIIRQIHIDEDNNIIGVDFL